MPAAGILLKPRWPPWPAQWRDHGAAAACGWRPFRVSAGDGEVSELIDQNLAPRRPPEASPAAAAQRLTTTRREALSLYRQIFRYSNLFVWRDRNGVPWRDVLRASARREFEVARLETDPETIARLLVGGRDAVQAAVDKFLARRETIINQDAAAAPGQAGAGGSGAPVR